MSTSRFIVMYVLSGCCNCKEHTKYIQNMCVYIYIYLFIFVFIYVYNFILLSPWRLRAHPRFDEVDRLYLKISGGQERSSDCIQKGLGVKGFEPEEGIRCLQVLSTSGFGWCLRRLDVRDSGRVRRLGRGIPRSPLQRRLHTEFG